MIVATIISGNNEGIIEDAIRSAMDQVDGFLLVDTGITDGTRKLFEKLTYRRRAKISRFKWREDFSAARNFALREAEAMKAKWAVTLDTDERLHFAPGFVLRERLQEYTGNVLLVMQQDGTYAKERVFRLPTDLKWHGYTHEGLRGYLTGHMLRGMTFSELPKTPEQLEFKNTRDIRLLQEQLKHEDAARWWFHLGATLQAMKRHEEAVEAFMQCASKKAWSEESAWACFMAAQCLCLDRKFHEAMECCIKGLSIRPLTRELAWLAGYAAYHLKELDSAIAWCQIAIRTPDDPGRVGFRDPVGYHEGPYEVLYYAHHALGHTAEAEDARQEWIQRKAARLGHPVDRPEGERAA